ncbi:uncharacterized protein AMSG_00018 [Thecamonas trahens ATCC 50062]|uniref:Uncharacterized protein n=1 Tax=Thecamonas trahens ATCC 50062 TaxID=461836 RepID=A0A0L0D0J9_THETB|nr:hypothetical protein AMSG_00018 [Thecamonas trahens ATCC 50062]KNC45904.1 hypothetical protein AMSG_00018 [Thecamonas trahens ATCC 50062]|eukprot:XP_013762892.1 hypothetical protein AMSG_00018 [Thecamonas trahens ATCC 50062]
MSAHLTLSPLRRSFEACSSPGAEPTPPRSPRSPASPVSPASPASPASPHSPPKIDLFELDPEDCQSPMLLLPSPIHRPVGPATPPRGGRERSLAASLNSSDDEGVGSVDELDMELLFVELLECSAALTAHCKKHTPRAVEILTAPPVVAYMVKLLVDDSPAAGDASVDDASYVTEGASSEALRALALDAIQGPASLALQAVFRAVTTEEAFEAWLVDQGVLRALVDAAPDFDDIWCLLGGVVDDVFADDAGFLDTSSWSDASVSMSAGSPPRGPLAIALTSVPFVARLLKLAIASNSVPLEPATDAALPDVLHTCEMSGEALALLAQLVQGYARWASPEERGATRDKLPGLVTSVLVALPMMVTSLGFAATGHLDAFASHRPAVLGSSRLKVIQFLTALIECEIPAIGDELERLGAVPKIIDLFFEFPWANVLHCQVAWTIRSIMEGSHSGLKAALFGPAALHVRILDAFATPSASHRFGYMGHLLQISNVLARLLPQHDTLAAHVLTHNDEAWLHHVTGEVRARNALNQRWNVSSASDADDSRLLSSSSSDSLSDDDDDAAAAAENAATAATVADVLLDVEAMLEATAPTVADADDIADALAGMEAETSSSMDKDAIERMLLASSDFEIEPTLDSGSLSDLGSGSSSDDDDGAGHDLENEDANASLDVCLAREELVIQMEMTRVKEMLARKRAEAAEAAVAAEAETAARAGYYAAAPPARTPLATPGPAEIMHLLNTKQISQAQANALLHRAATAAGMSPVRGARSPAARSPAARSPAARSPASAPAQYAGHSSPQRLPLTHHRASPYRRRGPHP